MKVVGLLELAVTTVGRPSALLTCTDTLLLWPSSASISGSTSGGAGSACRLRWYRNSPA